MGIAPNTLANGLVDDVLLASGDSYQVLYAWGDPTGMVAQIAGQPAYKDDASNPAIDQALRSGAHGVSVIELWISPRVRQWEVERPSPLPAASTGTPRWPRHRLRTRLRGSSRGARDPRVPSLLGPSRPAGFG